MTEAVSYTVVNGVAWLTIERPEARNALNQAVRDGLWDGTRRFNADDSARILVLTGSRGRGLLRGRRPEGDGADLAADPAARFPAAVRPQHRRTQAGHRRGERRRLGGRLPARPVLRPLPRGRHGDFAISEVKVGRGAPWAAPLSWLLPPRIALQILLTGDPISAQRARELGLVNVVVPAAELRDRAQALAERIAANAPLSVRAASAPRTCPGPTSTPRPRRSGRRSTAAPMRRKARAAFRDKRQPVWTGPLMPADMAALLADLQAESADLDAMIAPLAPEQYLVPTPAAGWCISDQVSHLAFFDEAALLAATDPAQFKIEAAQMMAARGRLPR